LILVKYSGIWIKRERISFACSLLVLISLHDARIRSHETWCSLRMS
jgi:hypothetical protein